MPDNRLDARTRIIAKAERGIDSLRHLDIEALNPRAFDLQ
jgi:hypothetical protein